MSVEMTAERGRRRLEDLYAAHGPEAVRLAFLLTGDRDLAEDLAQDAFVRVARRFGDLRGPEAFGPYLRKTVVNLCRGHWRRRKVERSYLARAAAPRAASTELPDIGLRDALHPPSPEIPRATLRKARVQRAMVGLGTCAAIVALGIGGFAIATGIEGTPDDIDVSEPQGAAPEKPLRFASGTIGDTRWSLAGRATADGICVTVDDETESGRRTSSNSQTLCGSGGDDLSLTQVSFEDVDPVLVFGTVPPPAHRAELILEDGSTEELKLRVRRGVSYYAAVVDDITTEGAVVSFDQDDTELDRQVLCAPGAPRMSSRGNVPQFCGDGLD